MQNFILELEGKIAGRFGSFSGGGAKAEVIEESMGGRAVRKHIANVGYQDMVLVCGPGMSREFFDWISSTVTSNYARKSGAIIALDNSQKPVGSLQFSGAILTNITFPALDSSKGGPVELVVTITPEVTKSVHPDNTLNLGVYSKSTLRTWDASSFQLSISGLEKDCRSYYQDRVIEDGN